jgi:hypothetical protein
LKTEVRALPASGCLFGLPTKIGECHNCRGERPVGWMVRNKLALDGLEEGQIRSTSAAELNPFAPRIVLGRRGRGKVIWPPKSASPQNRISPLFCWGELFSGPRDSWPEKMTFPMPFPSFLIDICRRSCWPKNA